MRLEDFDYNLPEERIAQEPLPVRDESRLLVLDKTTGTLDHRSFLDLPQYLEPGDLMVLNNTRVVATRLHGHKEESGGAVEALLLSKVADRMWRAMVKPGRRVPVGTKLRFGDQSELSAVVVSRSDDGGRVIEFTGNGDVDETIAGMGEAPLPPYICKRLADRERYQTVYAETGGSAAAPTAGLHFTPRIFDAVRERGVETAFVTLHVGIGTFRPVRVENVLEHEMHSESVFLGEDVARKVNNCSGRIIAVGTTTARALESAAVSKRRVEPMCGETQLFVTPGYEFKIIDALVTNFHLPRSTLLMLVSAFAGREAIMNAYKVAADEGYRFLSFGDAMFIY